MGKKGTEIRGKIGVLKKLVKQVIPNRYKNDLGKVFVAGREDGTISFTWSDGVVACRMGFKTQVAEEFSVFVSKSAISLLPNTIDSVNLVQGVLSIDGVGLPCESIGNGNILTELTFIEVSTDAPVLPIKAVDTVYRPIKNASRREYEYVTGAYIGKDALVVTNGSILTHYKIDNTVVQGAFVALPVFMVLKLLDRDVKMHKREGGLTLYNEEYNLSIISGGSIAWYPSYSKVILVDGAGYTSILLDKREMRGVLNEIASFAKEHANNRIIIDKNTLKIVGESANTVIWDKKLECLEGNEKTVAVDYTYIAYLFTVGDNMEIKVKDKLTNIICYDKDDTNFYCIIAPMIYSED